jgi:protein-disulfide isomerase
MNNGVMIFKRVQGGLKQTAVSGLLAAALVIAVVPAVKAAELSKSDIEQIVHDYVIKHPDVVMKAADDYQRTAVEERRKAALKLNRADLFDDKSPFIGNPRGDVTLVEFFDYNCHYCKQVFPALKSLADSDKNVKIIFKDFPILSPTSELAAKWAIAAQKQGKYFVLHEELMKHDGPLTEADIEAAGAAVKLDLVQAKKDVESPEAASQIERNRALAAQMSFNSTPSFVINDQAFSGVPQGADLQQLVTDARQQQTDEQGKNKADTTTP